MHVLQKLRQRAGRLLSGRILLGPDDTNTVRSVSRRHIPTGSHLLLLRVRFRPVQTVLLLIIIFLIVLVLLILARRFFSRIILPRIILHRFQRGILILHGSGVRSLLSAVGQYQPVVRTVASHAVRGSVGRTVRRWLLSRRLRRREQGGTGC